MTERRKGEEKLLAEIDEERKEIVDRKMKPTRKEDEQSMLSVSQVVKTGPDSYF